ncbi:Probable RNA-directed DNA polymerase from transposon BS [Eumeta japonica]|uniref:Probable RNA-directed DNA polymerase from transposon BS n=1 Tax=Eumeta variegata TaxID=151549 RepID=A0A4C1XEX9_EUMVA|nr:Probable RNA-directed DNA polymerase from transposon BS [Eumeta japonica]
MLSLEIRDIYLRVEKWFTANNLLLNEMKTKRIRFSLPNVRHGSGTISVRNKELEFVNSTVFLGITLDNRLQWGPHITKAFDRVWHAGLVYKLYSLQVPDRPIIIIQNYLADRYFTFRHERTHSTRRLIRAGVPQGSALSPLLYSAYTNNIPRPTSGVQIALFADDTALYYKRRNMTTRSTILALQRAIDELGQWFRLWRIEVNPEK